MADGADARRIALSLEGTTAAPHFDRMAFKVVRNYATLAANGQTINLKFTPDEQEFKCLLAPEAFAPIPNGWGRNGWTVAKLAALDEAVATFNATARRAGKTVIRVRPEMAK